MARHSPQLGELVSRRLRELGLSPRDVAQMSEGKVSHMTVNEMTRGVTSSPKKIATVALTLGDHPDAYLEAAGEPFRYVGELDLARVRHASAPGLRPAGVGV